MLNSAPTRYCAGGCGARVRSGKCPSCSRGTEQRRGSAAKRGYGPAWQRFRPQYIALLVQEGIVPCCGADLPDAPWRSPTRCQSQGLMTGDDLHLDHDPPLTQTERSDVAAVCNPLRIRLLCASCHSEKTRQEQRGHVASSRVPTRPPGGD